MAALNFNGDPRRRQYHMGRFGSRFEIPEKQKQHKKKKNFQRNSKLMFPTCASKIRDLSRSRSAAIQPFPWPAHAGTLATTLPQALSVRRPRISRARPKKLLRGSCGFVVSRNQSRSETWDRNCGLLPRKPDLSMLGHPFWAYPRRYSGCILAVRGGDPRYPWFRFRRRGP